MPDTQLLLTRAEAAKALCVSVKEIDRLRRLLKLRAKKHNTKVLIPLSELQAYVDSLPWEADQ